ncbi:MAG: hypothetical protein CO128_10630 [Ignavibacteriales bacterium CG_4_9_14_3_um_filter_30_11]|nr:MAG: hypothetical protein CO128_10630 [Ignavibacteriales bacterium CG_4_9_14_3_um_filter_30_11]
MNEPILKRISKIFLWLIAAIIILYIGYLLSELIIILIVSVLLAFIFEPFAKTLERQGFNRLFSVLIVYVVVGFLLFFAMSIFVPKFILQMNQLRDALQIYSVHDQIVAVENEFHKILPFFTPGEISDKVENFIKTGIINSFEKISSVLNSIVSIISILVIVPFITFMLLKDRSTLINGIIFIVPNKYFEMSYLIFKSMNEQLGKYVRGWIFDAAFVGIFLGLGLYFIGIKNALPLGLIGGIGHLIPYFGPIIGGIPAIIISIIQYGDVSQVPAIVILILFIYTIDNGIVQPYVFSKSANINPIFIIILIIAGGQLFGLIGMLLAVPVASVVKTAAQEVYFTFKNYKIARM